MRELLRSMQGCALNKSDGSPVLCILNPGPGCLMQGYDNPGLALNLNSDMKA